MRTPKERIIFDNISREFNGYSREDAIESLEEQEIFNPSKQAIYDELYELEELDWLDEKARFEELFDGSLFLVVGTCGLWNGNFVAGKVISTWNELMQGFKDCDYFKFWDENGHLYISGAHHDGINTFEMKQLTEKGSSMWKNWEYGLCTRKINRLSEREIHEKLFTTNAYSKIPHFAHRFYGCPKVENIYEKEVC